LKLKLGLPFYSIYSKLNSLYHNKTDQWDFIVSETLNSVSSIQYDIEFSENPSNIIEFTAGSPVL